MSEEEQNKFNKMCPHCGGQKTDSSVQLWPFFKHYCQCQG